MQVSGAGRERGWGLFPAGWVGEALQFVSDVWNDLSLPRAARLEPRITKLLSGAITTRYEREERDWFCTVESPDWNEQGKEISRTDIRLYPPGKKRRSVSLVLESKRLNCPASRAAEYVGAGGMMCFIPTAKVPAKYAAGLPCGAMLGYVLDGKVLRAHKAVCKAIKARKAALFLTPDGEYKLLKLANAHELNGLTKHHLPDGEFIIYHLLLPVRWN